MARALPQTGRLSEVVRTCIGCRQRSDKAALVRIVAVQESSTNVVTLDLERTLPGRGAHLHPSHRCLELAIRRKAFGRALRLEGPLELSALTEAVEHLGRQD